MLGKTTEDWVNEFLECTYGDRADKQRSLIDRKELYQYEEEIGKSIFEMNADDIIGFLSNYRTILDKTVPVKFGGLHHVTSILRAFFNFYINHKDGQLIENPMKDKRFWASNMCGILYGADSNSPTRQMRSRKDLDDFIAFLYAEDIPDDRAIYYHCICQLFYCGVPSAKYIVLLKEEHIDLNNKIIYIGERRIHLTDICVKLLQAVHKMSKMSGNDKTSYVMCHYHDGYFKFPVMTSFVDNFDSRSIVDVQSGITRKMRRAFLEFQMDANVYDVFMLGFYDYIVREHGVEKTNKMINTRGNREYTQTLYDCARKYGIKVSKPDHIKTNLLRFAR